MSSDLASSSGTDVHHTAFRPPHIEAVFSKLGSEFNKFQHDFGVSIINLMQGAWNNVSSHAAGDAKWHHGPAQFLQRLSESKAAALQKTSAANDRLRYSAVPFCSITDSSSGRLPAWGTQLVSASKDKKDNPNTVAEEGEERILISEVEVVGVSGELKQVVAGVLSTKPNFSYTATEIKDDLQRVFQTGYFQRVEPLTEDTRDGVKLTIKVRPNRELKGIVAKGADTLPNAVVEHAFAPLYGKTLNFNTFMQAIDALDRWYQEHGVLGQVIDFSEQGGIVDMLCAEAKVNTLNIQFLEAKSGNPTDGRTQPDIILRHFNTRPNRIYSMAQAKADLDSLYSTGLFDDININAKEAESSTEHAPKVDLTINLVERRSGGLGAGTGISAQSHGEGAFPGFVGSFSYSQKNLFGLNQKLSAQVELGQKDQLFRIQHVDPWVRSDPYRTSRTVSVMNTRSSGNAIHGRAEGDPEDQPGSNVVLGRLTGGVEYRRPLATQWSGVLGLSWQRTRCMDERNQEIVTDCYGSPLTFSGGPSDTMLLSLVSAQFNGRERSKLLLSMEQAVPLHRDWLNFNRFQAQADQPVSLGPMTLNLMGKGGFIYGDLPPYEAFPIGGTNSVRGYPEGGVGSGRYCLVGTAELEVPLIRPLAGTLFVDYGTDLDSGDDVVGDPAGARGKPGSGYGYGAGIRVDSPLGPLRLEYAWNDLGQRRFHVGLGSHGMT